MRVKTIMNMENNDMKMFSKVSEAFYGTRHHAVPGTTFPATGRRSGPCSSGNMRHCSLGCLIPGACQANGLERHRLSGSHHMLFPV